MSRLLCVAVLTFTLAIATVQAADVDNGQKLAERWCASCHLVSATQRQASPDVTPFSAMARIPAFDAHRLAFFLLAPHPKMPDMSLTRREAEDLAAYIGKQAP
jgi:mono/diheme cytochrome c family protein